ncbi:alpha/beta hydrolase [Swingsia samuiensis]|uniref:Biotin synthase n=1 Tax=Swingsia samuiensis TaxID=1293412 RepID=A0A4Y6UHX3_9PROT|nr:alpha/beta hydrolase [Swingsia samuiensis]QDH17112.1 biotin synthase [Swingsia samuiensis]
MTPKLYFAHGWSFEASFWHPVMKHLSDFSALYTDEGYFKSSKEYPAFPDEVFFAIGHSAGSFFLFEHIPPQCAGIILFNGFSRFSSDGTFPHGVSPRVLTRMQKQLLHNPQEVLHSFRQRCGDHTAIPPTLNVHNLSQGLADLAEKDYRPQAEHWLDKTHWMTGKDDPFSVTQNSFTKAGKIVEGGHLLPLERPELCASFIRNVIANNDPNIP